MLLRNSLHPPAPILKRDGGGMSLSDLNLQPPVTLWGVSPGLASPPLLSFCTLLLIRLARGSVTAPSACSCCLCHAKQQWAVPRGSISNPAVLEFHLSRTKPFPLRSKPGEGREICTFELPAQLVMHHSGAWEACINAGVSSVSLQHKENRGNGQLCSGAETAD